MLVVHSIKELQHDITTEGQRHGEREREANNGGIPYSFIISRLSMKLQMWVVWCHVLKCHLNQSSVAKAGEVDVDICRPTNQQNSCGMN